jgi:hypothetical protein
MNPLQYFDSNGTPTIPAEIESRHDVVTAVIKGRFNRAVIDIGSDGSYCHHCHSARSYHAKRAEAVLD